MEDKKPRKKLRYTVLMVPNNAHKVKQFHISFDFVIAMTVIIFVLLFSGISYMTYSASKVDKCQAALEAKEVENKDLSDQNILLQAEVEELNASLHDAKVAIDAKDTAKQQQEKEQSKQYIPSGFPVDGAAALPTAYTDETQYVVFTAGYGTKIVAAGDGTVSFVGDSEEFGHIVKVDHGNGYISVYMNTSDPAVSEGDKVIRGSTLYVIQSDNETLTYQIQFNEQFIDPMTVIEISG